MHRELMLRTLPVCALSCEVASPFLVYLPSLGLFPFAMPIPSFVAHAPHVVIARQKLQAGSGGPGPRVLQVSRT